MRTGYILFTVLIALGLGVGCASSTKITKMKQGEERVVDRIPDRPPKWLDTPFEETKESLLVKGEASKGVDGAICVRQAKANAVQHLVEAVKIKARSEYSEAVRGVNVSEASLGRYLDSVIAWTSENIEVSGIVPQGEYREKVLVRTYDGARYYYNCFARLSVPIESYLRAREAALSRSTAEAQDADAKALAEKAKEKLSR